MGEKTLTVERYCLTRDGDMEQHPHGGWCRVADAERAALAIKTAVEAPLLAEVERHRKEAMCANEHRVAQEDLRRQAEADLNECNQRLTDEMQRGDRFAQDLQSAQEEATRLQRDNALMDRSPWGREELEDVILALAADLSTAREDAAERLKVIQEMVRLLNEGPEIIGELSAHPAVALCYTRTKAAREEARTAEARGMERAARIAHSVGARNDMKGQEFDAAGAYEAMTAIETEAAKLPQTSAPILCTFPECDTARALDVAQRAGLERAAEYLCERAGRDHDDVSQALRLHAAAIRAEAQALKGEEKPEEVCEWVYDNNEYAPKWDSSCGEAWCFIDGGPEENRVRYCHGCGKPVKVV